MQSVPRNKFSETHSDNANSSCLQKIVTKFQGSSDCKIGIYTVLRFLFLCLIINSACRPTMLMIRHCKNEEMEYLSSLNYVNPESFMGLTSWQHDRKITAVIVSLLCPSILLLTVSLVLPNHTSLVANRSGGLPLLNPSLGLGTFKSIQEQFHDQECQGGYIEFHRCQGNQKEVSYQCVTVDRRIECP